MASSPRARPARALLLLAPLALGCEKPADELGPRWPRELREEGYVGSEACADCHEQNHASWYASYHRRMTQAASPEAILAPFEGRTPWDQDSLWLLEREGDAFYATPASREGEPYRERMRVALTTGSHHYQLYWLACDDPEGLLALPFVWHAGEQRWLTRRSQFLTPPRASTPFEVDRWKASCIECHATNGTPEHPDSGASRVADFGISCEACHGPGERHVALRRELAARGRDEEPEDDFIVDPALLPHERSSMVCGQCHAIHPFRSEEERARWRANGFDFRPGDDLARHRELLSGRFEENSAEIRAHVPAETLEELFWADGEVRVSGREYNGLVESPCYQRGELSCLSCHTMHPSTSDPAGLERWADDQLRRGMDGARACTSCHSEYEEPELVTAHTHHAVGSSGSECMNCHMPYTTYGLTKAIRSHTITSPDAAVSFATGRPNACNVCHLDRSLGWAADHLADWFGHERPDMPAEDEEVSATVLHALRGDAGQRALAAWALGWEPAREVSGTGWIPYLLSFLLADTYDAVVRVALVTARRDPRYADLDVDLTLRDGRRVLPVTRTLTADWKRDGLESTPEQRAALLLRPDGTLDGERVQDVVKRRDNRDVRLAE